MSDRNPMANEQTPATPTPDVWARIMRFAPVYVVVFCIVLLVIVGIVRPFESPSPAISVHDALVGADFDPTGAYMVIHNAGGADTLLSASTPAAASVQLQTVSTPIPTTTAIGGDDAPVGGILMNVDRLEVPGFEDLRMQPGSDQLLLEGLIAPLSPGQTISITLQFERAGAITVDATVAIYDDIADRLLPPRLKLNGEQ